MDMATEVYVDSWYLGFWLYTVRILTQRWAARGGGARICGHGRALV